MTEEIGLQELLHQVKKELLAKSADDPVPLFYVQGVELELNVAIRSEGRAGIKLYVVDIGGAAGMEHAQKVRVSLQPLYGREEMRRILEKDPDLGPLLPQTAAQGIVKGGLFGE